MYEDFSPDRILGQLAVRKRVVTPDQMAECLAEQEALAKAGATPPPLGALLIRKTSWPERFTLVLRARLENF